MKIRPLYDRIVQPPDPGLLHDLLRLPTAGALLEAGGGTVSRELARLTRVCGTTVPFGADTTPVACSAVDRRCITAVNAFVAALSGMAATALYRSRPNSAADE